MAGLDENSSEGLWGAVRDLAASIFASRPVQLIGEGWHWWQGLFDAYAWQEIGAYMVPVLVVILTLFFWRVYRIHLSG